MTSHHGEIAGAERNTIASNLMLWPTFSIVFRIRAFTQAFRFTSVRRVCFAHRSTDGDCMARDRPSQAYEMPTRSQPRALGCGGFGSDGRCVVCRGEQTRASRAGASSGVDGFGSGVTIPIRPVFGGCHATEHFAARPRQPAEKRTPASNASTRVNRRRANRATPRDGDSTVLAGERQRNGSASLVSPASEQDSACVFSPLVCRRCPARRFEGVVLFEADFAAILGPIKEDAGTVVRRRSPDGRD